MRRHLAIFKGSDGEEILQGTKITDIRLSNRKIPPFAIISPGDLVYIKRPGGDIIGQFKVKKVIFQDSSDEKYKYSTEIFIGETQKFITSPIKIPKRDGRGWVTLD